MQILHLSEFQFKVLSFVFCFDTSASTPISTKLMNESTGEGLTLYNVQSSASAYLFWNNQPWFIHGIVEFGQKPHMISKHNEHILVVQVQLKG